MSVSSLIIDSRNRQNGQLMSNFTVNITPALQNVRQVRLAYSDISLPNSPESYMYLMIPELGSTIRSSNGIGNGTFFLPTMAPGGNHSYLLQNNAFTQIADGNGVTLSQLSVRLSWGSREQTPPLLPNDFVILLQFI